MFTASFYVILFFIIPTFVLFNLLSILLIFDYGWIIAFVIFSFYIGLIIFTGKSTSGPRLTFFEGLKRIAQLYMSGCANITLLYIFPILSFAFLAAFYHSCIGIGKGKEYVEKEWIRIVREYEQTSGIPRF